MAFSSNRLNNRIRPILALFLILLPFTNLFAFTQIISLPLIISIVIGSAMLFDLRFYSNRISMPKLFSMLFLVLVLLSFSSNMLNFHSTKPFNHLFAYFFTIIFYYISIRHAILFSNIKFDKILYYISIGVIITSFFTIVEFLSKNIFYAEFDSLFFRPAVSEYQPYSGIETIVIRARSTVEESGHYALYLIAFAPIVIQFLFINKVKFRYLLTFIIIVSFLLTFSVAGIVAIVVGLALFILTSFHNIKFLKTFFWLIVSFLCFNFILGALFDLSLIENVILKFSDSSSSTERFDRFHSVFKILSNSNIINYVFGFGPAAYDTLNVDSFLNLYLVIGIELGILTLLLFIFFIFFILFKWFKVKSVYTNSLKFSFLACLVHYNSIHNYYYPWFWVLIILIETNQRKSINE